MRVPTTFLARSSTAKSIEIFSQSGKTSVMRRREMPCAETAAGAEQRRGFRQIACAGCRAPCRPARRTSPRSSRNCPSLTILFRGLEVGLFAETGHIGRLERSAFGRPWGIPCNHSLFPASAERCPAPRSCPFPPRERRPSPAASNAWACAITWSDGNTPITASGSIDCRMCAARPMAGAVLRCCGSAMICLAGTSGSCRTISSRR